MLKRLRFLGVYVLFWVMLFEGCRVLFLLYEWRKSSHLSPGLLVGTLASGLRMDLSAACYLTVIPLLIVAGDGFIPPRVTRRLIEWLTIPLVLLVAVVAANTASWRALENAGLQRIAEGAMSPDNPVDDPLHYVYRVDRP